MSETIKLCAMVVRHDQSEWSDETREMWVVQACKARDEHDAMRREIQALSPRGYNKEIERLRLLLSNEQNAARENVERLRGENAKLAALAAREITAAEKATAVVEGLRAENDVLKTQADLRIGKCIGCGASVDGSSVEMERLRGENAALVYTAGILEVERDQLHDELDWFRRREPFMQAAGDALAEHAGAINEGVYVTAYQEWLDANPKPGPAK